MWRRGASPSPCRLSGWTEHHLWCPWCLRCVYVYFVLFCMSAEWGQTHGPVPVLASRRIWCAQKHSLSFNSRCLVMFLLLRGRGECGCVERVVLCELKRQQNAHLLVWYRYVAFIRLDFLFCASHSIPVGGGGVCLSVIDVLVVTRVWCSSNKTLFWVKSCIDLVMMVLYMRHCNRWWSIQLIWRDRFGVLVVCNYLILAHMCEV